VTGDLMHEGCDAVRVLTVRDPRAVPWLEADTKQPGRARPQILAILKP
jgi:hypothetical protein